LFSYFDKQDSLDLAIKCAEENRKPTEDEGIPHLSGVVGSACWQEGLDIRSCILRFYNPQRIHNELPDSFGEVAYEEKNEKGESSFKYRKMTRCDILCSEVQFSSQSYKEIDMSLKPEAIQKREQIAKDYLRTISKSGNWCSTPSLIAFAFLRVPAKPVRVYALDMEKNTVSKYTDIIPKGCLPCCPTTEDEFLLDIVQAKDDSKGAIEKNLDDDDEWSSEEEESSEDEETEEVKDSMDEEVQEKMENVKLETSNVANNLCNVSNVVSSSCNAVIQVPYGVSTSSIPTEIQMDNTTTTTTTNSNIHTITSTTTTTNSSSAKQEYTYNFTRILFSHNHYDLVVTASERQRIVAVWPQVEKYFEAFGSNLNPVFNN
jgi:hypothetical protein